MLNDYYNRKIRMEKKNESMEKFFRFQYALAWSGFYAETAVFSHAIQMHLENKTISFISLNLTIR